MWMYVKRKKIINTLQASKSESDSDTDLII